MDRRTPVEFADTTDGMELMAAFVAQLLREGITFKVENDSRGYRVILTGGY